LRPPYTLNPDILVLLTRIGELVGLASAAYLQRPPATLRRKNRIRTIQGTLAVEGNTLNEEQVTAILEGQRVLAKASELVEVSNAIRAYDRLEEWDPYQLKHFRAAHGVLMDGLAPDAGRFRGKAVGVVRGKQLAHLAPSASGVPTQMAALLNYLKKDPDPILIKSCVLHYEIEFIHPFSDGNGRMGRLWQTVALMRYSPLFAFLPVEALVRNQQKAYYKALGAADRAGDAQVFIVFMLRLVEEALVELLGSQRPVLDSAGRMAHFRDVVGQDRFDRKHYRSVFPALSTATASRDLRDATASGVLVRSGDGRTTSYRFKPASDRP
jgi:Fic family protein